MSLFRRAFEYLQTISRRSALLLAAAVLPPLLIFVLPPAATRLVAGIWLVLMVCVARYGNSLFAHQRRADGAQAALQETATQLGIGTSRDSMFDAVMSAASTLIFEIDPEGAASIVLIDKKAWRSVASTQSQTDGLRAEWRIQTILQTIRSSGEAEVKLRQTLSLDVAGRKGLYVPMISLGQVCTDSSQVSVWCERETTGITGGRRIVTDS